MFSFTREDLLDEIITQIGLEINVCKISDFSKRMEEPWRNISICWLLCFSNGSSIAIKVKKCDERNSIDSSSSNLIQSSRTIAENVKSIFFLSRSTITQWVTMIIRDTFDYKPREITFFPLHCFLYSKHWVTSHTYNFCTLGFFLNTEPI